MITQNTIQRLTEHHHELSVSIYLQTHRTNQEAQQDPIRFKKLLNEVEQKLSERGLREEEIDKILEEAWQLVETGDFWLHQSDGLAVFCTPEFFEFYKVPQDFDNFVYVDDRFFVTPLLPMLARDGSYYVLALSQKKVRLLDCTRDSQARIELEDIPESYEEFQENYTFERHSGGRPSGANGGMSYHGLGDDQKEEQGKKLQEFISQVETGVTKYMKNQGDPLVLAGVGDIVSTYRQHNKYNELVEEFIKGNTDEKSDKQLRNEAWKIIKPHFLSVIDDELDHFANLSNSDKISKDLEEVVKASRYGRVETLFVPIGTYRWGKFDESEDAVLTEDQQEDGFHDLYNYAALHTLTKGGKVYALSGDHMPGYSSIAAIFRY